MPTFLDVKNLLKAKLQEGLEVVVANTALNYFESRITEQKDIQGNTFKKRIYENKDRKGRAVLIKSGNLRRSIQIKEINENSLTIAADTTLLIVP